MKEAQINIWTSLLKNYESLSDHRFLQNVWVEKKMPNICFSLEDVSTYISEETKLLCLEYLDYPVAFTQLIAILEFEKQLSMYEAGHHGIVPPEEILKDPKWLAIEEEAGRLGEDLRLKRGGSISAYSWEEKMRLFNLFREVLPAGFYHTVYQKYYLGILKEFLGEEAVEKMQTFPQCVRLYLTDFGIGVRYQCSDTDLHLVRIMIGEPSAPHDLLTQLVPYLA